MWQNGLFDNQCFNFSRTSKFSIKKTHLRLMRQNPIQLHDKIRVFINKLLKTKIKDGGFVFSLIIAVITYFTPFNEVLESAFDIVHYFTHDIFV